MSAEGTGELVRLTTGERLLVDRRRREETQGEAAARHGVGRAVYGRWERSNDRDVPAPKVGRLSPNERCLLYRRRADKTQAEVAKDLGCCRWAVNQMERNGGACDTLLWYWEQ